MFQSKRLDTPLDKLTRKQAGRRSVTRTDRKRGRYIRSRPAGPKPDDIAFDATLRTAAIYQRQRHVEAEERGDETMALRTAQAGPAAQGARATGEQPDPVCGRCQLVDGGGRAHGGHQGRNHEPADGCLSAPAIRSVWWFSRRTALGWCCRRPRAWTWRIARCANPGGRQDAAQQRAAAGISHLRRRSPAATLRCRPLIILLTDGAGNVGMTGMPAQEEAMHMARLIHQANFTLWSVNIEHVAFDRGSGQRPRRRNGHPAFAYRSWPPRAWLRRYRIVCG